MFKVTSYGRELAKLNCVKFSFLFHFLLGVCFYVSHSRSYVPVKSYFLFPNGLYQVKITLLCIF